MAGHEFRAVERNLSRIYYLELIEHLQDEEFLKEVRRAAEVAVASASPVEGLVAMAIR